MLQALFPGLSFSPPKKGAWGRGYIVSCSWSTIMAAQEAALSTLLIPPCGGSCSNIQESSCYYWWCNNYLHCIYLCHESGVLPMVCCKSGSAMGVLRSKTGPPESPRICLVSDDLIAVLIFINKSFVVEQCCTLYGWDVVYVAMGHHPNGGCILANGGCILACSCALRK